MTSDEKKILANMILLRNKTYLNEELSEEKFFYIYQLIDGYSNLKKYFNNSSVIDSLLQEKYNKLSLETLIRHVRNRHSHIDKQDKLDEYIILLFNVPKEVIVELVDEIYMGLENIVSSIFDNNYYQIVINSKPILSIFELYKSFPKFKVSDRKSDQMFIEKFYPLLENFNYEESTIEELNDFFDSTIFIIEDDEIKEQFIFDYGIDTYNELLRMISDDSYTDEEAKEFIYKVYNQTNPQA